MEINVQYFFKIYINIHTHFTSLKREINVHIDTQFKQCGLKHREKKFRLFMSSDYGFLSRMYGITGAQGGVREIHMLMKMLHLYTMQSRTTPLLMVHHPLHYDEGTQGGVCSVCTAQSGFTAG